jgi:alkylation response protein AidB-like acyl-CoA dehydrogenase
VTPGTSLAPRNGTRYPATLWWERLPKGVAVSGALGRIHVACTILNWDSSTRSGIYTIFEGTSEIQRLVISRAISGIHIN